MSLDFRTKPDYFWLFFLALDLQFGELSFVAVAIPVFLFSSLLLEEVLTLIMLKIGTELTGI